MKLHRFYIERELPREFWMNEESLFHQWIRVLRFEVGREVVLFNNQREERLYKMTKIGTDAVHLELVTEMVPNVPDNDVYLCFSLLKKDKNDWVLQKGTELGVRHFVPLLCDRTEKTGFDEERARKIVIEAAEQCGRADIPSIREPLTPQTLVQELAGKVPVLIAEQGDELTDSDLNNVAVLVGSEGGWSDEEKAFFKENNLPHLSISRFTLRAETAAVTAAARLCR